MADFSHVLLVVLIGKGVKLAEGHLDTHSKISTFNRDFIFNLAQDCGVAPEILAKIQELNTARELLQLIPPKTKFYRRLTEMCKTRCIEYTKKMAGIEIDEELNKNRKIKEKELTKPGSKVRVFVIPTNEELGIAKDTFSIVSNL
ncbi:Cobalt-precorrin-5B C(1)-methyltransferase [bioreactor metagenome]|uniref:Cobalt-precorrin-5B C(1)-methyltransferase n=1 Tax=bioreactor metagenome TaxID=1076179 RepID=A0A645H4G7_9ZZZZ